MKRHNERPRALILTRNLPPLVGGMERLIWHVLDELRPDYEVQVVGPRGSAARAPAGVQLREVTESPLWRFLAGMTWKAITRSIALRPRLVLAGSGLTAPFAWLAARLVGAKAVVYLHGLDIEATHRLYRVLWLPFIRRCDLVLVNSRFTHGLALKAGVDEARIQILNPGVDLPDLTQATAARQRFRERHDLGERPVMLYVGRITARKGLAPFVENSLPEILAAIPEAILVVIGDEPEQALLKGQSLMARIERSLEKNGLGESVRFLGARAHDDPEISEAYFASDVHVFPVQDRPGDNEGFGMVAIEAAAHGLQTVAFAAGGVPDAVRPQESGTLVDSDNFPAFTNAVIDTLRATPDGLNSAVTFAEQFGWAIFGQRLNKILSAVDLSHED